MASSRREAGLTPLKLQGGRTVIVDNRTGRAPADFVLLNLAKRGAEEGYTVISNYIGKERPTEGAMPKLYICTLLRPGKHTEQAGAICAMGTLAAAHAIERNSETSTEIYWLGGIHPERRRFSPFRTRQIATVWSQSLLLPSGFLDYMILHAEIDMPKSRFPIRMVDAVASIFTSRPVNNADHLTQSFLHDFFGMYDMLKSGTTDLPFWNEYCQRSFLLGKRVRFRDGKKVRRGKAVSVTETGALVIAGRGGTRYELTSQSALITGARKYK